MGMGWVGSWVHKFTWHWVGLGWVSYLVGWVGLVDENRPTYNSDLTGCLGNGETAVTAAQSVAVFISSWLLMVY